jgi:hypothetical protein
MPSLGLFSAAYDSGAKKMHETSASAAKKRNMRNRIIMITPYQFAIIHEFRLKEILGQKILDHR